MSPRHPQLISLDEMTRRHVTRVMRATAGNKSHAAAILGIDRRTLYRMLDRYGITAAGAEVRS